MYTVTGGRKGVFVMGNTEKTVELTAGSPGKGLLRFAMPMILGNLFQQFYNMADTIIVGRYIGEDALAAVGASYALTTVFIMIAIGGGTGATVITAQYLGSGQKSKTKTSISTALLSFLGFSIILGIFGLTANRGILLWMDTPGNILKEASVYLKIYFTGLPFLFMYNILAAVFQSLGDSKTPLYLLIFSSVLNVMLDLLAVVQWKAGVGGAALATVVSQGVAAVISFTILVKRLKKYQDKDKRKLYDTGMLRKMIKVAIPTILQQSIISIGMLLVQSVVNDFGSSVLAGYTAGMRLESICVVPMIATGNAVATFTAQNIGAKQIDRVRKGYRGSYGIIMVFGFLICMILLAFKNPLIAMFLEEDKGQTAFDTGISYLSFIAYFFPFLGFKAVTDGVLRGSGDVGWFTAANVINLAIRVIVAFLWAPVIGVEAVWYAVPIGWIVNYVISGIRYLSGKWSRIPILYR